MAMPGRTQPPSGVAGYRYAHNGQEKDNEIFDGALSAEFWEYDSRLGRRWENDPIIYEGESPYACFSNNPILLNDPLGLADGSKKEKKWEPNYENGKEGRKARRKINRKRFFSKKFRDRYNGWKEKGKRVDITYDRNELNIDEGGKWEENHNEGKINKKAEHDHFTFGKQKGIHDEGKRIAINFKWLHINWPHIHWPHIHIKNPFKGWGMTFSIGKGPFALAFGFGNWQKYNMLGLLRTKQYSIGQIAQNHDPAFSNPAIKIAWHTKIHHHVNFIRFGTSPVDHPLINIHKRRIPRKKL